jgi:hypothetical protein
MMEAGSKRVSSCRLHFYLAREAPIAVVLRRGPSAWARLSLWHTQSDTIEHGQWIKGRVYPRRCDVPDGSLFAYFVHKASGWNELKTDSWAAVSRPPHFTALAVWASGTTYHAGGFFESRRALRFVACHGCEPDRGTVPRWLSLEGKLPYIDRTREWTDRTVFFSRLLRDGWTPEPVIEHPHPNWHRLGPDGRSKLVLMPISNASSYRYGGYHAQEYALQKDDDLLPLGEATWADWDHRGRLILAQDGCLWQVDAAGERQQIEDFNPQTPEPIQAPEWAQKWPAG